MSRFTDDPGADGRLGTEHLNKYELVEGNSSNQPAPGIGNTGTG